MINTTSSTPWTSPADCDDATLALRRMTRLELLLTSFAERLDALEAMLAQGPQVAPPPLGAAGP